MKVLGFLKKIVRRIPGFRRMSSQSIVVAATWYGVALLTMTRYWHWGLLMLALPFFVFYVIDGKVMRNRAFCRVVALTAGALVLLGAVGGTVSSFGSLPAGGLSETAAVARPLAEVPEPSASAVHESPPETTVATPAPATVSLLPTEEPAPTASPALSPSGTGLVASPAPSPGLEPYVASKTGKVFHLSGCASAKRIKPENRVLFKTRAEAVASGRTPCKQCKP